MANEGITWNHSNDVIFNKNSFLNFVSLIQAHGDLSKLQFFSMMDTDKLPDGEFTPTEKTTYKRDIAVVRYDLPLDTANPTTTNPQTKVVGRHQFLRTGSYITIAPGTALGTISVKIDDDAAKNIYVKGFSVGATSTEVKFSGSLLPNTANTYSLGSADLPWKNIYTNGIDTNGLIVTGSTTMNGNVTIGSSEAPKKVTINGRSINFGSLPTATGAITQFLRGDGVWSNTLGGSIWASNTAATADIVNGVYGNSGRIYFYSNGSNSNGHNIGIYGVNKNGQAASVLYITPDNNTVHFGAPCQFHSNIVDNGSMTIKGNTTIGSSTTPVTVTINGRTLQVNRIPSNTSDSAHFWRGDGYWSNELTGTLILSKQTDAQETSNADVALVIGNRTGQHLELDGNEILSKASSNTRGTLWLNGSSAYYETINNTIQPVFRATRIYNAVFNDYAECRKTIDLEPGRVVIDNDDGSLSCSSQRLQPGAQVISDTYGHSMGETDNCKTPLAVAGRVLVYTYQPRENYHAGMAVCSAPNGTVDIMTKEEIIQHPDCIMGIVSEIPNYDTWGTNEVKVDRRIWIKVR